MSTTKKRNGTTRKRRSSLAACSPAPQGPTGDDILNRFRLGQHIIEMKAQLKYLEQWAAQLDRDIAEKRVAVQANVQSEPRSQQKNT